MVKPTSATVIDVSSFNVCVQNIRELANIPLVSISVWLLVVSPIYAAAASISVRAPWTAWLSFFIL